MTKKQQAHALQIAMHLRSRAQIASTPGNLDTLSASAANELERQHARIAELEDDLQFVERWAVHHGSKPSISAEEALSCIQHYPAIHEITKSYKDGKRPDTFNPYARIAELEGQLEAIGAGGVEPLRKQAAQAVHQIAEPAAPVGKPIKDAIDALVMAAFTEGGCSEHRMSEARIQTELRKKELCTLLSTPQECARSHPHEEMTPMCELRTEVARLTNALARAEAQLAAPHPLHQHLLHMLGAKDHEDAGCIIARLHALELAAAPQAVQAAVPEAIEQMAVDRYKVVPSHESMFHRWAVVAGNGTQQLYIGREVECQNMALKFAGAFLDGAFVAMQNTAPAHPVEAVQAAVPLPMVELFGVKDGQETCLGPVPMPPTMRARELLQDIGFRGLDDDDGDGAYAMAACEQLIEYCKAYYEAPAHHAEPFMWAIQEPGGGAYMDENCVSTSRGIVEAEVDGLNLGLDADDEPYKVVPVYLAATQPAAQGMDAKNCIPWVPVQERVPAWTEDDSVRVLALTADDDFGGEQVHDIKASDFYLDGGDGVIGTEITEACTHWVYRDDVWPHLAAQAKQGGAA